MSAIVWAALALTAIPIFPTITLCVLASKNVKRGNDIVRIGFGWFHVALWSFFLSLLLPIITMSVMIGSYYKYISEPGSQAIIHIGGISDLCLWVSIFTFIISLATLANGAYLATTQHGSKGFAIFIRSIVGLASALYFAVFVYNQYSIARAFGGYDSFTRNSTARQAFYWISVVVSAFTVIAAIATTVFIAIKRNSPMRAVWNLLLAASIVALVVVLWNFIADLVWNHSPHISIEDLPGLNLAGILFYRWILLGSLVLIYVLGKKTFDGLWSEVQGKDTRESHEQPVV